MLSVYRMFYSEKHKNIYCITFFYVYRQSVVDMRMLKLERRFRRFKLFLIDLHWTRHIERFESIMIKKKQQQQITKDRRGTEQKTTRSWTMLEDVENCLWYHLKSTNQDNQCVTSDQSRVCCCCIKLSATFLNSDTATKSIIFFCFLLCDLFWTCQRTVTVLFNWTLDFTVNSSIEFVYECLLPFNQLLPIFRVYCTRRGFPGGTSSKEPTYQHRRPGFDSWVGKLLWRRKWQPTPVFLPR